MKQKGLVYVFTGDGKGKTSAALGVAVRAVCAGLKVGWIAWYKEASWKISEFRLPQFMPIDFFVLGRGFYIQSAKSQVLSAKKAAQSSKISEKQKTASLKGGGVVLDTATPEEHRKEAEKALSKTEELLKQEKYNVIVCDEICNALSEKLLDWKKVKQMIEKRGKTHLVLTGRNATQELVESADLVTQMQKVKHPYDLGNKAVKGLDF
ncbi:MAG: cob(I)yrinic acid a,c-diamide adenosyltransferase [Patescibacteria group bacterium]|jgi:cob(I)alamin adenosyltransferase